MVLILWAKSLQGFWENFEILRNDYENHRNSILESALPENPTPTFTWSSMSNVMNNRSKREGLNGELLMP
jgi:hypothetical protein